MSLCSFRSGPLLGLWGGEGSSILRETMSEPGGGGVTSNTLEVRGTNIFLKI